MTSKDWFRPTSANTKNDMRNQNTCNKLGVSCVLEITHPLSSHSVPLTSQLQAMPSWMVLDSPDYVVAVRWRSS